MVYCDRCDRSFGSYSALHQHEDNSSFHNICHDCEIDFPTWVGLKEHYVQSRRHFYCQHCDEHFQDDEDLESHYDDSHHYCGQCRKIFKNEHGLHEHYRQSPAHHYCEMCDRNFQSESNLRAHLNSSTHKPKSLMCPLKDCGLSFVSQSAVLLHMEGGRCRSGMNRNTVNQLVRKYDTNNTITDPSRMLTNGDSTSTYLATNAAWNSDIGMYECYLCHGTYSSLFALNQHLASPRHEDKIYVCPLDTCRTRFNTLSALCQHIESQRCGVHMFKPVRSVMARISNSMGLMITM